MQRINSSFKDKLFCSKYSKAIVNIPNEIDYSLAYPMIIPAMVAERSDAREPPIKAFIPNSDRVFLCQ